MTSSLEYPDLKWVPPKSWTNANRTSVQLVVIHDTEGSEGPTSAEDGAAYDQRRTDGTSCHFFHDSDSTVQCVRTEDIAHAARHQGNLRGIQHELCGRAGQGSAGWADAVSQGTLRHAARQVARDCRKWGIPARKLSAYQVAAGSKGICGHADITYAFPQDNGTHTDPGPTFPWSQFLAMVQAELEDDMNATEMTAWAESAAGKAALAEAAGSGVHGQRIGKSTVTIGMALENLLGDERGITAVITGAKGEIIAAITEAGVTLSEAQVTAIGDAVGNAANQALQRVVSKLERAGSALTQ